MKTKEEFKRQFFDVLLGMAVRLSPANDEAARGLFIRERQQRIGELLEAMYAFVAEETKPAIVPAQPKGSNGTTTTTPTRQAQETKPPDRSGTPGRRPA